LSAWLKRRSPLLVWAALETADSITMSAAGE